MSQVQTQYRGLNLREAAAVLVRFHFTNPRMIPQGLRSVERKSERELLERLKQRQGVDNVRGYEALDNVQQVQAAMLRTGLANNGLRLVDSHVFENRKPGKTTKHVVNLGFRRLNESETSLEVPTETHAGLRSLATEAVWSGHGWWNPNGVFVFDFVQRQPGVAPRHAFVARNGWIVAVPTAQLLEEQEEDRQVAAELLEEFTGFAG